MRALPSILAAGFGACLLCFAARASADARPFELRAGINGVYRAPASWNERITGNAGLASFLGFRWFSPGGHGAIFDVRHRVEWTLFASEPTLRTTPLLLGYGHRFLFPSGRNPGEVFYVLTPFAGVVVGAGHIDQNFGDRSSHLMLGVRTGLDFDMHVDRLIFGFTLSYEYARHFDDEERFDAHYVDWGIVPVFRFGVTLGPLPPDE